MHMRSGGNMSDAPVAVPSRGAARLDIMAEVDGEGLWQAGRPGPAGGAARLDIMAEVERQVLWLSTAIVHHANRVRPNPTGLKVGGHQASCASIVSIMIRSEEH